MINKISWVRQGSTIRFLVSIFFSSVIHLLLIATLPLYLWSYTVTSPLKVKVMRTPDLSLDQIPKVEDIEPITPDPLLSSHEVIQEISLDIQTTPMVLVPLEEERCESPCPIQDSIPYWISDMAILPQNIVINPLRSLPESQEPYSEQGLQNPSSPSYTSSLPQSPSSPDPSPGYIQYLLSRIETFKFYPRLAQERGWVGKVHLTFRLDEKGKITHLTIQQSSGYSLLDQAALNSVQKASPFLPPPPSLIDQELHVIVSFVGLRH